MEIDLSMVPTSALRDEYLGRVTHAGGKVKDGLPALVKAVADYFGESVERLLSRERTKQLARQRQAGMVAVRRFTGLGGPAVAAAFNRHCHGTVYWAEAQLERGSYQQQEVLAGEVAGLLALFQGMASVEEEMAAKEWEAEWNRKQEERKWSL